MIKVLCSTTVVLTIGWVFLTGSCGSEDENSLSSVHLENGSWHLLTPEDPMHTLSKAVGVVEGMAPCTGTLIGIDQDTSAKVKLLTAGHCVEELLNENWNGKRVMADLDYDLTVTFPIEEGRSSSLSVRRLLYASIVPYDLAVFELEEPYEHVLEMGYRVLRLGKVATDEPIKVWNIAYPQTGDAVVATGQPHVQKCQQILGVKVREYLWTWEDSLAVSCVAEKGSSGSPLLVATRDDPKGQTEFKVGGIINTKSALIQVNDEKLASGSIKAGEQHCGIDNPCLLNGEEKLNSVASKIFNYGQPTQAILQCYNPEELVFETETEGCPLGTPDQRAPVVADVDLQPMGEGQFRLNFTSRDEEGSEQSAGVLEVSLLFSSLPMSVPLRHSLETSTEMECNGVDCSLKVDLLHFARSFGLDLGSPIAGAITIKVADESMNWSTVSPSVRFEIEVEES